MKSLALHEIGEVIRKVRKQRGLRLEDLADENISPATVSNIERGIAHVSPEKVSYLLEKLDLPKHKLPEMLVKEQEDLKKVQFDFLTISTLQQIGHLEEALDKLEQLNLDENHPYIAHYYYYKGSCYLSKKKWKQAERAFYNALRSAQHHSSYKESNIEAATYLLLGLCHFYQNHIEQALEYTNNGIKAFVKDGKLQYIRIRLYANKGMFLHRLGRYVEGMRLVEEIWDSISAADDIFSLLQLYWLRAEFSFQSGLIEEAIHYAYEGIEIARRNKMYSAMFSLWTLLGNIYTHEKKWELAETSLITALKLEEHFPACDMNSIAYTSLAVLYIQLNRKEKAYNHLLKAIQYAEQFQDHQRLIFNLQLTGDLCHSTGNTSEATQFYRKAIELTQKHGYKEKEYQLWFKLARCYDGQNEVEFQNCMRKMFELKGDNTPVKVDLTLKYTS
ncbi:helix-turn-helix domain-containing protein [Thermoflavimicrobium dichotomicum]|uniref:Tetratricopeptide repeat-containing protein n=1 Tax=Thermoflavimicrobium dichotomicum TaxID=46223 RepID=A0A1I3LYY1_9BACL|nr:helix-turn-helix domain-containing protein [Thermoflavimicrobium dichotomicum]SFI89760.1 Tetratricopeptide repeat-containing protein [Thermoflavimicrobium dichotomicum]